MFRLRGIYFGFLLSILIPTIAFAQEDPIIKVKLSHPELRYSIVRFSKGAFVSDGSTVKKVAAHIPIIISKKDTQVRTIVQGSILMGDSITVTGIHMESIGSFPLWKRTYSWDSSRKINDNTFQGALRFYADTSSLLVVNELPLSYYMKGVAEVPEQDAQEKRKALSVIARSYAAYYSNPEHKKFTDERYNASDNPQVFQKYLGYGFSLRSPKWQEALNTTSGEVLLYNNTLLRAAYSSCTDTSGYRKTPKEAGWSDPYFAIVEAVYTKVHDPEGVDPVRAEKGTCGHGVGLSGLGATNLAMAGKNYKEILLYYYKNVTIGKKY